MTEVAGVQREAGDGPADPEDRLLTVPNVITVVRLLCLPVFLWLLFGREDRVMAAIVLGALGATDWVDGYIARHWNQVSKAGKVLDPVADRLLFFVGGIGIIVDGSIPTWVAVAVLVREVAVSVATIALALAVIVPVLIPGLGDSLIGGEGNDGSRARGSNSTVSVINPILDLRHDLRARTDRVVLTYRTSVAQPEPLRIVSADVFDGTTWSPSPGTIPPADNRVQAGLPDPPGLNNPAVKTFRENTRIAVGQLNQNYLPLPYPSTKVDVTGTWLYDMRSLNVIGQGIETRDLDYSVEHLRIVPTAEQLAAAPAPAQEFFTTTPYTNLPSRGFPQLIRDTARRVAGDGPAFSKAVRLQNYFRNDGGFQYTTEAPGDGNNDSSLAVMEVFLKERRGYCVHFASTMAVMARTLQIPARVAVGFLPGDRRQDGSWEISLRDAHAWPELYFQGVGWVRFEPTPGTRGGTERPTWAVQDVQQPTDPVPTPTPTASEAPVDADPGAEDKKTDQEWYVTMAENLPWRVVAAIAVLTLLAFLPMVVASVRRRIRWRRAKGRVARAEAAWEELRERLGDLGVAWSRSRTPRTVQTWLGDKAKLGERERAALGRLVSDLETARYVRPDAEGGRETGKVVLDVRTVTKGVTRAVPGGARRKARWLPASAFGSVGRPDSELALEGSGDKADPSRIDPRELDTHLMEAPR